MNNRVAARLRSLGLVLLLVIGLFAPSVPAEAQRRKHVRVVRPIHVNVHRRGGYWRGVRVGAAVAALPRGHAVVVVGGRRFFHYGGVFYAAASAGYVVVAAPLGAVIAAVPEGCAAAPFGGVGYNYCGGTYYAPAPGGFAVVAAPIGITVDELPVECSETVTLDGVEHYSCEEIYYRPVVRDGATMYITVKR